MKKMIALVMLLCMMLSLVACGSTGSSTSGGSKDGVIAEGPYAGIDISKPVEITMYLIGSEATDKDKVVEKINERLKAELNATLDLQIIPLSEFATRYPLILSGGEKVDLIYAAALVNFKENVSKKAFLELTDEFLNTYMPQTMANHPAESWKQVAIDGKIYAVPRNEASYSSFYNVVLVRKELREKYNIPELETFEDYENYLLTIAENETGIYGFYNMPTFKPAVYALTEVRNNVLQILKGDNFIWADDGSFDVSEVEYLYDSEVYREYALKMADWAKAGVWPSDAIAGTVSPNDYFTQGRSASIMTTVEGMDGLFNTAETNGITDVEAFDIYPDATARKSEYNGDAVAIPYSSENPERAAMVLDMLKNDKELNMLIVGGIEGEHYIYDEENNTRELGPSASNYSWDGFTWAIRNDWNPKVAQREITQEIRATLPDRTLGDYWPCFGFSFNNAEVKTQATLVEALIAEYSTSFDLGVFGDDTEAKLDEFIGKLEEAGLAELKEAYLGQLSEFIGQ